MFGILSRSSQRQRRSSGENWSRIAAAIQRHHNFSLHPGQISAGQAMIGPAVAEMATGEGKTAASLLTIAQGVLSGQRVFVATANDYLARRDAEFAAPVLEEFRGTVGCLQAGSTLEERQSAYQAQVVYGTIREFVFDFLRDRLASANFNTGHSRTLSLSGKSIGRLPIQSAAERLLIDEADSLLIDEAATPCVVSGEASSYSPAVVNCLAWGARIAGELAEGEDYLVIRGQGIVMTPSGRAKIGQRILPSELASLTLSELFHWLELSIHVHKRFKREVDYVVRDGKVEIVDESTGRVAEGRRWSNGIHQAIEAREGVPVTPSQEPQAQLTLQEYIHRFHYVSGMTGTAAEVVGEFRSVYGLHVVQVPLHRPNRRQYLSTIACQTREEKLERLVEEVRQVHSSGRPILIGTRTIRASHELAERLADQGIPHVVLNALNPHEESPIIAEAGQPGRVTVATNLAGRGTDIRLHPDAEARGGLHVIGSELHSAARIDRQLFGRCARQGDPGSCRQYLSLEDDHPAEAWGMTTALHRRKNCHSPRLIEKELRTAQRRLEQLAAERRNQLCIQQRQRTELLRSLGLDPVLNPVVDSAG